MEINGKIVRMTKFHNFIPFAKIRPGKSIYFGYNKKHISPMHQVFEENQKGERQYEFIQHDDKKCYEIKRLA